MLKQSPIVYSLQWQRNTNVLDETLVSCTTYCGYCLRKIERTQRLKCSTITSDVGTYHTGCWRRYLGFHGFHLLSDFILHPYEKVILLKQSPFVYSLGALGDGHHDTNNI